MTRRHRRREPATAPPTPPPRKAAPPPPKPATREEKKESRGPPYSYLAFLFYLTFSAIILQNVTLVQPEPYLDEVFHVPQTQNYCNGSFEKWDNKITTLPGTYIFATFALKIVSYVGLFVNDPLNVCSTYNLRLFNSLVGIQNFHLIKQILMVYMKGQDEWKILLSAVNISMFPVLYFFNFLYYTDVTSTFWVLLMHWAYLKNAFGLSALSGAMSVMTRQTNIVWVAWHCLLLGFKHLVEAVVTPDLVVDPISYLADSIQSIIRDPFNAGILTGAGIRKLALKYVTSSFGYIMNAAMFASFVLWNGGIVVGDKSAHVASLNVPQLGYFTIVFGFFCAPFIVARLPSTLKYAWKRKWRVVIAIYCFAIAVYHNTVAHPYLLADNRHYPFYLWKNVFQSNPFARYALIPAYVLVWAFIFRHVDRVGRVHNYYPFTLLICAALQLVPQLLLEFRYFIPVYLMARLTISKPTWFELICEYVLTISVNIFTFYLFLNKPFSWPGSDDEQRFMW